jgi:hypothetical protein
MEYEYWSIKEHKAYTLSNALQVTIGGVRILTTPAKEPLVVKIR